MSLNMGVQSHQAQVLHGNTQHIMVTMSTAQPKKRTKAACETFLWPHCAICLLCFRKDADHLVRTQNSEKNQSSTKHQLQRKNDQIWDF